MIIRRRYDAGLRNFFRLYRPVVDAWMLFDNSSAEGHPLIASHLGGAEFRVANQNVWNSLQETYA